eukprot:scaffold62485_cov21-Prasinocladus_malaysianus.AAC.1
MRSQSAQSMYAVPGISTSGHPQGTAEQPEAVLKCTPVNAKVQSACSIATVSLMLSQLGHPLPPR